MDAPQTPGDWGYRDGLASYRSPAGEPRFTMRCDRQTGTVVLARPGPPAGQMTVRTESQTRTLPAPSTQGFSEARVSAGDRLLDAMAFSKGRFAIETPGAPALYLPSWAEVTRVIQDCR